MKPAIKAIIDVKGADRPSCVYAIEHVCKKFDRIRNILVDAVKHEMHVSYEGNSDVLKLIVELVGHLGYCAQVRSSKPVGNKRE
jgi:hypothetical protein